MTKCKNLDESTTQFGIKHNYSVDV